MSALSKEKIKREIRRIVNRIKEVRFSLSTDGGLSTTTLSGKEAVEKIEKLIAQAKITRIVVLDKQGNMKLNISLVGGVTGGVFAFAVAPVISIVAGLAGVLTGMTLSIEADEKTKNST